VPCDLGAEIVEVASTEQKNNNVHVDNLTEARWVAEADARPSQW